MKSHEVIIFASSIIYIITSHYNLKNQIIDLQKKLSKNEKERT
jgi:cell division protein FtsL